MRIDVTVWNLLQNEPILGNRGLKELRNLVNDISNISGDSYSDAVDSLEDFIVDSYGDDGDSFINSLLYAYSELLDDIQEYFGAESADEKDENFKRRFSLRRNESHYLRNEAYKSFSRWANAIERQSSRLDWTVATPKYKHPSCVWNGDLYCTYNEWDKDEERYNTYVAGVSESPDGKNVSVYVFKTHGDTKDVIMSDVVLKGNIVSAVKKHKEDIPYVLFNEMVKMFDMYSLTN